MGVGGQCHILAMLPSGENPRPTAEKSVTCRVRGINKFDPIIKQAGTAVAHWLRCCATNQKAAGSIQASVTGIFHGHKILPITLWPWG